MPRPTVATLVLGDFNLSLAAVNALAAGFGGDVVHGAGPDYAIVRGADVVAVHTLGRHGSDHQVILFELDVDDVPVRALLWNVYVGQDPDSVRAELEQLTVDYDPDVIVLVEAYRCRAVLRDLSGYRRPHHGPNVGEGADVAVLVAKRHQILNQGRLVMRHGWIGPKHGKRKAGREYPFDRIRHARGPVLRVLGVHLPTGGPEHRHNGAAVRESINRITHWARPKSRPRTKEKP